MKEQAPVQKEFGEIERIENGLIIKKFGTESQVGKIFFEERKKPTKHYFLRRLDVVPGEQGKGFGSQLMTEMERISKESGMPLVLTDGINASQNIRAVGMYSKRTGWIKVIPSYSPQARMYIFGDESRENVAKLVERYSRYL